MDPSLLSVPASVVPSPFVVVLLGMRVPFGVGSMMARMEGKKQHLAHVRRKDVRPRLRNGYAICGLGQWFCLDLCGFGCFSCV
jgi:hypothetical protein